MSAKSKSQSSSRSREATVPASRPGDADLQSRSSYLLVFEGRSSRRFPLPERGEVLIARSESADLQLQDVSVSRQHAKIILSPKEASVVDLGSQNGTLVNGQRFAGARSLVSGDVLTLGSVTIVFRFDAQPEPSRPWVPLSELRFRAEQELDRSQRYQRPWAVLSVRFPSAVDRTRITSVLEAHLKQIESVAWDGTQQLLVILPECAPDAAAAACRELLNALLPYAEAASAGFATCPHDGISVDALLASARDAAFSSGPGRAVSASTTYRTHVLGDGEIIVADPAMEGLLALVTRLGPTSMPVLITGETGTGKDVLARALHYWSSRRDAPLVALNCAAIPDTLIESELFGYERGAFTGADKRKVGLLSSGDRGTVVLDEVGELPSTAQAKLLRVLETMRVLPLGTVREREVDVRIVACSNRDLESDVRSGKFRSDLYFRLKGADLWIPPLRHRPREIPIMAQAFLARAAKEAGRDPIAISSAAMHLLAAHDWPGNVRELRSLMEYVFATVADDVLRPRHLADWLARQGQPSPGLDEIADADEAEVFRPIAEEVQALERSRMLDALAVTGGNRTRAARLISMPLRTFTSKMKTYGLSRLQRRRDEA